MTTPAAPESDPRPRPIADAMAYGLALASIVPVSWLVLAFAYLFATGTGDLSWRRFAFGFFSVPETWQSALGSILATVVIATVVLRVTRARRRAGYRLAQAAGRLGKAGIALSALASIAIGAAAIERFLR